RAFGSVTRLASRFPSTTVAVAELPADGRRPSHRRPETVSAQVNPEHAPRRFPVGGSGAVASAGWATPTHKNMPVATATRKSRSERVSGSFKSNGPISNRYRGAVDCKNIALADVVNLVASVNVTRVAA